MIRLPVKSVTVSELFPISAKAASGGGRGTNLPAIIDKKSSPR